ncbi:hypothetical protein BB561_006653 [Smittium simulii]|uniref:SCP domain-containing protein n=1 Tax=Smittium simulii TaxID=133385 RepID=A0A2T9Y2L3_9FUNG|nr:hypothetical protein BB561_006653 [Smittium simulii]
MYISIKLSLFLSSALLLPVCQIIHVNSYSIPEYKIKKADITKENIPSNRVVTESIASSNQTKTLPSYITKTYKLDSRNGDSAKVKTKTATAAHFYKRASTPDPIFKAGSIPQKNSKMSENPEPNSKTLSNRSNPAQNQPDLQKDINGVVCETNKYRKSRGLKPLKLYNVLSDIAQNQSEHMYKINQDTHDNPSGSLGTRLRSKSVPWLQVSENVADGYLSPESVVSGWIKSPEHLANLVDEDIMVMGVGRKGDYWTQNFAKLSPNFKHNAIDVKC